MLSLIGKDLRAGALYLCVKVPTLGFLLMGALLSGKAFLVVSCVSAAILVVVAPALDWSVGADRFLHSLPVSRRDVVKGRYAWSLLLAAAWLALAAGMALLFAFRFEAQGFGWPPWVAAETALTAVIYVSVFIAVFLGCVFRFGMVAGGASSTLVMAVVAPFGIRHVRPEDVGAMIGAAGAVPVTVGVVLAAGLATWVSMRLSMGACARREF